MQKFEGIVYGTGDFSGEIPASPRQIFVLKYQETELVNLGCAVPGDFSEETSFPGKVRLHRSHNGLTASLELTRTIPFGSEPEIRRVLDFAAFGVHFSADFAPKGQPFRTMKLEPVTFGKLWQAVRLLVLKEGKLTEASCRRDGKTGELLSGSDLIVWCEVRFENGCRAGFGCGNDLWRHAAAKAMAGAEADFRLTCGEDGSLRLERTVFAFPKEAEVEVRPWRFKTVLFFAKDGMAHGTGKSIAPDWKALPESGKTPCLAAAPARRMLRELLRKTKQDAVLELAAPALCFDAGHLDRAGRGEMVHWDVEEFWELYCHFGRKFAERGQNFTIRCGSAAPESLRSALSCPMTKLFFEGETK